MLETAQKVLQDRFGLEGFRFGQQDIIQSVLNKRDTLAVMPTGGGKSLCYQLPGLMGEGITVVVSPLIALMNDQVSQLKKLGIAAGCLHSGQEMAEKKLVFEELRKNQSQKLGYLLFLSPERVALDTFTTWYKNQNITLLAIDEAHCISQWGPDFRQDYHRLSQLRKIKPEVPILALTATATPLVLNDIAKRLELKNPSLHVYGFYRNNLFPQIIPCTQNEKLGWVLSTLRKFPEGRIIIYCGTRKQCLELHTEVKGEFKDSAYYHAGLSAERRSSIQEKYSSGKVRILFATNAFGMGIDHSDVRCVLHYQMPANIESYYQEMGRAGRDGKPSTCVLLYSKKDKGLHSYFIQSSEAEAQATKLRWRSLDTFVDFLESYECRHGGILTYFKDTHKLKHCGHCDVCDPVSERLVKFDSSLYESAEASFEAGINGADRSAIGSSANSGTSATRIVLKKVGQKSSAKKSLSKGAEAAGLLDQASQLIYDHLREWRKKYADAADIPAFVVFSDKTLRDLCLKRPKTLGELEQVHGFGPKKTEALGPEILKELAMFH